MKRWVVEPPTAHSSSGSETGTAASASSCNSYQNSPAIGLTNATEPYDTPAVSGEKSSEYIAVESGPAGTVIVSSPNRPSPDTATSKSNGWELGLTIGISTATTLCTGVTTGSNASRAGGAARTSIVYHR